MGLRDVVSGVGGSGLWSHDSGQSVVSLRPALCSVCVSVFSSPLSWTNGWRGWMELAISLLQSVGSDEPQLAGPRLVSPEGRS